MIIVTGGAGFIGSAITAALNSRGVEDILIVDELGEDEKWKNLRNLRFADYLEVDDFNQTVAESDGDWDIEAIFHMGACSDTTETDATYLVKNNYEFSKLLCNWALSLGTRFIYASSAATYGDGSEGFSDDEDKLERLRPLNMYGYSKQLFDLWLKRRGLLDQVVGLKYFNVFGPNEYHKGEMRSFVHKAFEQIRDSGKVRLFQSHRPDCGHGQQRRDFIYIKDAVEMTLFFAEHPEANGIYNIGTGQARTWNDLAEAVFRAMGKETCIEYIPMPESLRPNYQYFTQADITKLRNAGCKITPRPLEEAVREYVQDYLMKGRYLGA